MYFNMRSRAGLVALVFPLIISLVSAVPIPIPASQSTVSSSLLSHSSQEGQDLIQRNIGRIAHISKDAAISTFTATTRAFTSDNTPVDAGGHQLVRRNKRLNAKIRGAFRKLGRGIKHLAQKIGHGIKKVAQKIGHGIKKVAQKIGHGIKKVAQKVGNGIKKVAKKVGTFIKTNIKKAVKFGLKIASTVAKVAAKVVGFIPGIGKPLGKVLEGYSKVTDVISNKIHANLGKKLEKGMKVMDKADKIMGYIPRDFSEKVGFQDIHSTYDFFEVRDDDGLEDREEYYFDVRDIDEDTFDYYLD